MANPWQPGYVLDGRFELVELVGAGAMGVVWRVSDREWGRDLALKMPQPVVLQTADLRERFVREAETWIGLGIHPHIVQCWFVNEVHGLPCLFLDYLTGGSLKTWMERGHVQPGQWGFILEIAMQVAEGLSYAHSKGVVHRDVKPENLMIRGDERVCVTDFGIVKTLSAEEAPVVSGKLGRDAGRTAAGSFMGTPRYGAPEQWGAANKAGPTADVYALGVMLYEMCCGRRPFDTENENVEPLTLIKRHLSEPPPDPRQFRPDIPPELARICLHMLAKRPDDRPGDMSALREIFSTLYQQLTGKTYPAAAELPSARSPDVLNNQAFSFSSLGKRDEAVEILRQALSLDPGHPECLYNLIQLEKRSGRISHDEGLRRLKQARAHFPYSLLCIEEGLAAEAYETLQSLNPDELSSPGLYHRARGDALMYQQRYAEAERAYARAHELMPNDANTVLRGHVALNQGKHPSGAILFPSSDPVRVDQHDDPSLGLLLNDPAHSLLGITESAVFELSMETGEVVRREERVTEGARVLQTWISGRRLLVADIKGFEFRSAHDLRLLIRRPGRVLACSPNIDRVVTLDQSGPHLAVVETGDFLPIGMQGQSPDQGPLLAAFDPSGQRLVLLLPSGQLARLGPDTGAVARSWPTEIEAHKKACCLALTEDGVVVVGFADGIIERYDLQRRFQTSSRLPQAPLSLSSYCGGGRLVARTSGGFFVLDRDGRTLLSGVGPLAVDPRGSCALFYQQGRLVLYNLEPPHVLRRFPRDMTAPKSVAFSGNGRMAVALSQSGESVVWQMDEPHRVYQRGLLLSPGRGYADILNANQHFRHHLQQAYHALARREFLESYRHLQRGRKVPGFGHQSAALDFSWQLLECLRRDRLEAVWERMSLQGQQAGDLDLHPELPQFLFSFGARACLAEDRAGTARTLWTIPRKDRVRLLRFVTDIQGEHVLVADSGGDVGLHDPVDGRLRRKISLPGGPLARALLHDSTLTFYGQAGGVGQYDLNAGSTLFRDDLKSKPRVLGHWQPGKVLVATSAHLAVIDLNKPGSRLQGLNLGVELTNAPCFIDHLVERGQLVLAFASGTLHILDVATGTVLAALKHGEGRQVTGFQLLPELSVALTATRTGHLCFWDLRTGHLMEKFMAHRSGISALRTSHGGRYLLTAGADSVRYWETSWLYGDVRRAGGEASWLGLGKLLRGGSTGP